MAVGLQIKVGADVTGLMGAFQAAAGGAGSLTESLKLTVASMSPVGAAGVAVADALIGMTEAAAADRAEQEKLLTTYANATGSTQDYTAAIDAAIAAGAEKAFSDSEVRAGLEGLITATGDAGKANDLMAQSMDIARAAGVPLEQATDAVSKAYQGNDKALKALFPGMEKQATAADTITEATKLSKGAADDYATSAEGMSKKGSDAFGELGEKIGSAFLPILDEIMPLMGPIVEIIGELITAVLPLLGPAIDIVVAALRIFLDVLRTLIGLIKDVMGFVGDLVSKFQGAADIIAGIDLNPFALPGGGGEAPAGRGRGRGARGAGGGGGGNTINLNMQSADPEQVVRALRRWAHANGGGAPLMRSLDRMVR
jgi:phage-related protein